MFEMRFSGSDKRFKTNDKYSPWLCRTMIPLNHPMSTTKVIRLASVLKLILRERQQVGSEVGFRVLKTQFGPEAVPVKLNGPFGGIE